LTGVLTVAFLLEFYLTERLAAEFKTTDAERITRGFRQVLRGICDADVLLDGNLKIQDHSNSLAQLVSSNRNLANTSFQDLLWKDRDEVHNFEQFILNSTQASDAKHVQESPFCVRASFASSLGRVGVDVFHVALPGLYGDATYHLLVLKQDSDPALLPLPEANTAPHAFRDHLHGHSRRSDRRPRSTASVHSLGSSSSRVSVLPTFPHLEHVRILLNALSPEQDVLQVHLNYQSERRRGRGGEVPMPSLRQFVRPTDWEDVKRKVEVYSEALIAYGEDTVAPMSIQKIMIRMFDHGSKYMLADAKLSQHAKTSGRNVKMWLDLKHFVHFENTRPASELGGIHEQGTISSPSGQDGAP